ncbi:MAG: hypothetical protein AVDCRST_MAG88-2064, partial [uncultured Thermomicrobiales bacterium]
CPLSWPSRSRPTRRPAPSRIPSCCPAISAPSTGRPTARSTACWPCRRGESSTAGGSGHSGCRPWCCSPTSCARAARRRRSSTPVARASSRRRGTGTPTPSPPGTGSSTTRASGHCRRAWWSSWGTARRRYTSASGSMAGADPARLTRTVL